MGGMQRLRLKTSINFSFEIRPRLMRISLNVPPRFFWSARAFARSSSVNSLESISILVSLSLRDGSIVFAYGARYCGYGAHKYLDLAFCYHLHILDRLRVQRVGHRHGQKFAYPVHRDEVVLPGHVGVHQRQRLLVYFIVFQRQKRKAVLKSDRLRYLLLFNISQHDQHLAQEPALIFLDLYGGIQLRLGYDLPLDEQVAQQIG